MENEQIKKTEIVVVLDRSGSMGTIAQSTVDGFNTFLNEQKNAALADDTFFTLVQFDDQYEVNYKNIPVKDASELINGETYIPRGTTALYTSIGRTINELDTDRDVVFVIITDGHDNVKSEYNASSIKKMIETLEKENGYKFLFLAANQDAIISGGSMGIKSTNSVSYAATADGIGNTFYAMSANLTNYRSAKSKVSRSGYEEYLAENLDKSIEYSEYVAETTKKSLESLNFTEEQRKKSSE